MDYSHDSLPHIPHAEKDGHFSISRRITAIAAESSELIRVDKARWAVASRYGKSWDLKVTLSIGYGTQIMVHYPYPIDIAFDILGYD